MRIWVDADACPRTIKEILFRAANRVKIVVTLLANSPLMIPPSPFIDFIMVPDGFDEADNQILQRVERGDLVITADILRIPAHIGHLFRFIVDTYSG